VLGTAACSDGGDAGSTTTERSGATTSDTPATTATTTAAPPTTAAGTTAPTDVSSTTIAAPNAGWERVALGGVSAYVIVRGGEAAVIDTGNGGSAGAIEGVLTGLGVGWKAVGHVILTHDHPDHQGSMGAVMEAAEAAVGYAGAGDISDISSPRELAAVGDGDTVLGIDVIETPGHTPGHISLLDPQLSLLIAGDALVGAGGGVAGPVPRFTADQGMANASVAKLGGLTFQAAAFGHGEPILSGADQVVAELAATLQ